MIHAAAPFQSGHSRRPPRWLSAAASMGVALALALTGCRLAQRRTLPPPAERLPRSTGSAREAVLREKLRAIREGGRVNYAGDGWTLSSRALSGWRQVSGDPTSTLRLSRSAEGMILEVRLKVFAIRDGMPLETFLAAHRLWVAEEATGPVEYVWDEKLKETRGYSIVGDRETYYAFRVAGDRAYVIEAAARGGVLSRQAADEFDRLVAGFRCHARRPPAPRRKPCEPIVPSPPKCWKPMGCAR